MQLESGGECGNYVVAVHEHLRPSIVLLVHLLLIVDRLEELLLFFLENIIVRFSLR